MNFFFFGDSVCSGQNISPHQIWVAQIAKNLNDLSQSITVINASVNGNTTRMALERMPFDVQSHGVDLILIQFGLNDCNYWKTDNGHPRVSKLGFKANLLEIIERSRIFGAKEIFLNTNHPTPRTFVFDYAPITYQQSNTEYNQIIREVAEISRVSLIDIEKSWLKRIEKGACLKDLLPDGIHLSILGHKVYCEIVYPHVEKVIKTLLQAKDKKE